MQISAVITTYNQREILEICLDSLLKQAQPCSEIIVVDCGSTDGTAELIARKYPAVKWISRPGEQVDEARAINLGIGGAQFSHILLLNADVRLEEDCLRELAEGLVIHPEAAAAIPKIMNFYTPELIDAVGHRPYYDFYPAHVGQDERDAGQYDRVCAVFGGCLAGALIKKEVFGKTGAFDEDFCYHSVDDFFWRFNLSGFKCIYLPASRMYHRRLRSRVSPGYVFICERNRVWSLIKYYPVFMIIKSFFYTFKRLFLSAFSYTAKKKLSVYRVVPAVLYAWIYGITHSKKFWICRRREGYPELFSDSMERWLNRSWVSIN